MFIQIQICSQFILTNQSHLKNSITHPDTSFEQAKQIIMNIDALLHTHPHYTTKFYRN